MPEVQDVTSLPKPVKKALWKTGLKATAVITLIALGASAVYTGLKKGAPEVNETTENTAA